MIRQKIPAPGFSEALKVIRGLSGANNLQVHESVFKKYGDYFQVTVLGQDLTMVFHPDGLQHILKTNRNNYIKSPATYELAHLMGTGLLTSDGETWTRLHKALAPEFHSKRIDGYYEVITKHIAATMTTWGKNLDIVDAVAAMGRLSFSIATECLFGANEDSIRENYESFTKLVHPFAEFVHERIYAVVPIPLWVPTKTNQQYRKNNKALNLIISKFLNQNSRLSGGENNMLSRISSIQTGGCPFFDRQGLVDQMRTALLAGYETTTSAMSWTLYLLATHPKIQSEMREELNAQVAGSIPTLEELRRLEYSENVFLEAMRIYPPAPAIDREAINDDVVSGYPIRSGAMIEISPWITHRHPDFWPDPEKFNPRRFESTETDRRHPFAYIPFSGGPRKCIGEKLAMLEGVTTIAALVKNFKIEYASPTHPRPTLAGIGLHPDPGLFIRPVAL